MHLAAHQPGVRRRTVRATDAASACPTATRCSPGHHPATGHRPAANSARNADGAANACDAVGHAGIDLTQASSRAIPTTAAFACGAGVGIPGHVLDEAFCQAGIRRPGIAVALSNRHVDQTCAMPDRFHPVGKRAKTYPNELRNRQAGHGFRHWRGPCGTDASKAAAATSNICTTPPGPWVILTRWQTRAVKRPCGPVGNGSGSSHRPR